MSFTDGEALRSGLAPVMSLIAIFGWLLIIAAARERKENEESNVPQDAQWLGQAPLWVFMLTIGTCIVLLVFVFNNLLDNLLL